MYKVMYIPRIEDEVCVAEFETATQAEAHMEFIKQQSPKAVRHHYITQGDKDGNEFLYYGH